MAMSKNKQVKHLNESELIKLMNEEWDRRLAHFAESLKLDFPVPGGKGGKEKKLVISDELKVKHEESGYRYTIDSVEADEEEVVLRAPEGDKFMVHTDKLEKEYGLA
jgi:hypothetical protein